VNKISNKFAKSRRQGNLKSIASVGSERAESTTLKPQTFDQARGEITRLVRESSVGIVDKMISLAIDGEVAPAKYLFELIGLYPAVESTSSSGEGSLARTLLERMGLPTEMENS
jgi:hypothetical protein